MDKAFERLRTQIFDLYNCGSSSNSCQSAFKEFEAKYVSSKQLFLALSDKSLKDIKKEKMTNINSFEISLEEKEKEKEKEDANISSIEKYLKLQRSPR